MGKDLRMTRDRLFRLLLSFSPSFIFCSTRREEKTDRVCECSLFATECANVRYSRKLLSSFLFKRIATERFLRMNLCALKVDLSDRSTYKESLLSVEER